MEGKLEKKERRSEGEGKDGMRKTRQKRNKEEWKEITRERRDTWKK